MDYIALCSELLAHPRFRWAPGMITDCGVRLQSRAQIKRWLKPIHVDDMPLPDLNDPATKGVLLSYVRKAAKDPEAYACKFDEGWCVQTWPEQNPMPYYKTEGMALASYIVQSSTYIDD